MLEKLDLTKKMSRTEYKEKMLGLEVKLGELQRKCKELGIPVMIVFEGFDAAGKGVQIGELIHAMDPRGFEVYAIDKETKEERMHPFLWRFWTKTPEKGKIAIYDNSWYRKVLQERFDRKISKKELGDAFHSICSFEQQLTDDGTVLIKLFLVIDKKEQKKRFHRLLKSPETAWRVTKSDLKRNRHFDKYLAVNEDMLKKTDVDYAPWNLIEATDRRFAAVKIYTTVINSLAEYIEHLKQEQEVKETTEEAKDRLVKDKELQESTLAKADLTLCYTKEEYKKRLKKLQKKMEKLHGELYRRRNPAVLCFEGWDAGGKAVRSNV